MKIKLLGASIGALSFVLMSPVPAFAVETQIICTQDVRLCPDGSYVGREAPGCQFEPCPSTRPPVTPRPSVRPSLTPRPIRTDNPSETPRSCEAVVSRIKGRSESLATQVRDMVSKFDAIVARLQDYYTGTIVPSGRTVSNYASLYRDTQAKKAAVEVALGVAEANIASLTCDSANPRVVVERFTQNLQTVKTALAEYRKSIVNLIKAVYGFQRVRPSGSPRVGGTPRATFRPGRTPVGTISPLDRNPRVSPIGTPVRFIGPPVEVE